MENFIRSKRAAARYHFLLALLPKISHIDSINSRQTRTLNAIFKEPTPANVEWNAIEALLVGNGSRVRFENDGIIASFHRPHPAKEAKRYQVRDAKDYLIKLGVRP